MLSTICNNGEMSERSKEAVLKTVDAQVSGGSNPSLSVFFIWRGAREAESGSRVRSGPAKPGSGGSNPPFSEIIDPRLS